MWTKDDIREYLSSRYNAETESIDPFQTSWALAFGGVMANDERIFENVLSSILHNFYVEGAEAGLTRCNAHLDTRPYGFYGTLNVDMLFDGFGDQSSVTIVPPPFALRNWMEFLYANGRNPNVHTRRDVFTPGWDNINDENFQTGFFTHICIPNDLISFSEQGGTDRPGEQTDFLNGEEIPGRWNGQFNFSGYKITFKK